MRWNKLGCAFAPPADSPPWMVSHAALPVACDADGEVLVYFSSRDVRNRARIARVTVDPERGFRPRLACERVLDLGPLGAFDDSGVTMSCLVSHADRLHLYYTGWSLGRTVPFYLASGLAVSDDQGRSFRRVSPAPVLDRSEHDPYLNASPYVMIDGGVWRMWYVSAVRWEKTADRLRHYYHIRYAESSDGFHWEPTGKVCIDFADEHEYAIARPSVLRDDGRYKMWYCYRGRSYRIGYAESDDGLDWERKDHLVGIAPSATGWDSKMQAYPFVFDHLDQRYMLYNGNGYGATGFGVAVQA